MERNPEENPAQINPDAEQIDVTPKAESSDQSQQNQTPQVLPAQSDEESIQRRKSDPFGSENFLGKLETKIQENQSLQNELVKNKHEILKEEIREYFDKLSINVQKQIEETRDSVLAKVEAIIQRETGFVDWDRFREELFKRKEEYEKIADINLQKKAFDSYFEFYNTTLKRIDSTNTNAYNKIDSTAKLFKFDEIVLESFLVNFKSLCTVLESDFVTNVSFTTNHLDPSKIRLEELVQIPHPGVWCATEKIDKFDVFILGGRDGRVSMYDSKTLRVLDATQGIKMFVGCLLYIPQHSLLLIGGADDKIAVRRVDGRNLGRHVSTMDAEGYVTFLLYIEDEGLIASIGTDPNIRLYHPTSLVNVGKIPTSRKGSKPRGGAQYFKDKKLLLVGFDDGMFQFYNLKTKQLAFAIFVESTVYWGLTFHEPTGRLFAHTHPGTVKVWNFKGDRPVEETALELEGEGDKPYNIRIVDKYLLSASNNEKIFVYDLEERRVVKKIEVPSFKAQSLLVLEKEGRVIVTDEDNAKIASLRLH